MVVGFALGVDGPQGLKRILAGLVGGTAEAVPFRLETGLGVCSCKQRVLRFAQDDNSCLLRIDLGEDDDLAAGLVFFHGAVGFDDVVEVEDFADGDGEGAGGDLP